MNLNNNIKMSKLWQDSELMQLKVLCITELISAQTKIYASDELIDNLINTINRFLNGTVTESTWSNGEKGNNSTVCLSFHFSHKDKLGHERIEIFMELDDGGDYNTHNCCFYLDTENGLLTEFCNKLSQLKKPVFDIEVVLNDSNDF